MPDYMIIELAMQLTIVISRKRDRFSDLFGEVIARDVDVASRPRPHHAVGPWGVQPVSMATWSSLVEHLDTGAYDLFEEATRRYLKRTGPRA